MLSTVARSLERLSCLLQRIFCAQQHCPTTALGRCCSLGAAHGAIGPARSGTLRNHSHSSNDSDGRGYVLGSAILLHHVHTLGFGIFGRCHLSSIPLNSIPATTENGDYAARYKRFCSHTQTETILLVQRRTLTLTNTTQYTPLSVLRMSQLLARPT